MNEGLRDEVERRVCNVPKGFRGMLWAIYGSRPEWSMTILGLYLRERAYRVLKSRVYYTSICGEELTTSMIYTLW